MDAKKGLLRSKNFMSGVFVLTLSTVIVKIIGVLYKIPMLRLIGSEGMGYFNSAYEIYTLFCVISTAGLPVAMSVMISSSQAQGKNRTAKIFSVGITLFLSLGIVCFAIIAGLAKPFSEFLKSDNAYLSILFISPTVLFVCIGSAYRGYFQGKGQMLPTAISQVIEALGKLVLGIIFATVALKRGYGTETVAAFAILGLTLGMAVSMLYLVFWKILNDRKKSEFAESDDTKKSTVLKELMVTAIPVTLASAIISITKLIDMTMILRRLQAVGYDSVAANEIYGSYTTLALPLFSLAPALVTAVALPLVPAISAAAAKGDGEEQFKVMNSSLKLTCLLATPISLGLCVFSKEILSLLFAGEYEAIEVAYPLLSILGLSVLLSCLITVTNAVLQAYKKAHLPIVSMICGAGVKIVLAYFLIGNPGINIYGAPISTFFCNLTITLMNFYYLGKYAPMMPSLYRVFAKPLIYSAVAVGGAYAFMRYFESKLDLGIWTTVAAIMLAAIIYFAIVYFKKELKKDML